MTKPVSATALSYSIQLGSHLTSRTDFGTQQPGTLVAPEESTWAWASTAVQQVKPPPLGQAFHKQWLESQLPHCDPTPY